MGYVKYNARHNAICTKDADSPFKFKDMGDIVSLPNDTYPHVPKNAISTKIPNITCVNNFGNPSRLRHEDSNGSINPTPSNEYMHMLVTYTSPLRSNAVMVSSWV